MARPLLLTALALGTAAAAAQAAAQPTSGAGDRYGPGPAVAASPSSYGPAPASGPAPALRGRVLAWPGKVEPHVVAAQVATVSPTTIAPAYDGRSHASAAYSGAVRQAYQRPTPDAAQPARYAIGNAPAWRPVPAPPPVYPVPARSARVAVAPPAPAAGPSQGWRAVVANPRPATPAPQSATPTSIYAAPGPGYSPAFAAAHAAPPNPAATAERRYGYDPRQDHTVRFYSVARPFGLKPDPAPIPPQFFTATADLGGEPPGPLPINHTTATARAAVAGGGEGDGGSQ